MSSQEIATRVSLCIALLVPACGGSASGDGATPPPTAATSVPAGWLKTSGNRILRSDGTPWMGRGVNIHDTRSCNACAYGSANVAEVKRRIDEVVDGWGATFLRLNLESYATGEGRAHWGGVLHDPAHLADLQEIVRYVGTKPGVYVLVTLWTDPTIDQNGVPTAETARVWQRLAEVFRNDGHVLFGVANEPAGNADGARDAQVWDAMNVVVGAIRTVEDAAGSPRHLVAVQGTRQWARVLDYYVGRPIAAGGGQNVVYETHVYDGVGRFEQYFVNPSRTLPVIIGEFAPIDNYGVVMTQADAIQLMDRAEAAGIPYLAWTFHMRCGPALIQDLSNGGCGGGMPLRTTAWGELMRSRLLRR